MSVPSIGTASSDDHRSGIDRVDCLPPPSNP